MEHFQSYMERCEVLANVAAKKGNSAIGSILVHKGKIVAEAQESATSESDVSNHAEMEVLRKARKTIGKNMNGAILITTKEPCVMCSYAIRFHGISTVVYKIRSEWFGGASSNYNLLTSNDVPAAWSDPVRCILYSN